MDSPFIVHTMHLDIPGGIPGGPKKTSPTLDLVYNELNKDTKLKFGTVMCPTIISFGAKLQVNPFTRFYSMNMETKHVKNGNFRRNFTLRFQV